MHWCGGNDPSRFTNFGDMLGPYMYKKLTGRDVVFSPHNITEPKYVTIGSIIGLARPQSIVWGSGVMFRRDIPVKGVEYLAVRGMITQQVLKRAGINPPTAIGDPCLLLPRLYNPIVEKKYKLGIIPHVVDTHLIRHNQNDNIKVIDLRDTVEDVVDQLLSCERVISSSLHGIIVSDAYGIPCKWVQLSNELAGDGVKFEDHFTSIGITPYNAIDFRDRHDIDLDVLNVIEDYDVTIDLDILAKSCPFDENGLLL